RPGLAGRALPGMAGPHHAGITPPRRELATGTGHGETGALRATRSDRYNRQQNLACWAALLARRPGAPPKIRTRYTHHRRAPPRRRRPAHGRLRPPRLPPAATPPGGARLIVWP